MHESIKKVIMKKTIIDNKIFDDVFEAIRRLEKSHPILGLKDKTAGYLIKDNKSFKLMELPDGTIGAFPPNFNFRFYRGENDNFDDKYPCVPKIFRIKNQGEIDLSGNTYNELILIDRLRIAEFAFIAKQFPQVRYAIDDYCNVDFDALAQHYDLNTDLLDMSSDIAVAAFFATHTYDPQNGYQIKDDGIGCLRVYVHMATSDNFNAEKKFRLIGLQPFQRPGIQCAFAIKLNEGEDFSTVSGKVLFRQTARWNSRLHDSFYERGSNILFPKEDIEDVSELVRDSKRLSKISIKQFCDERNLTVEYVETILAKYNISISGRLIYSLSRQQRKKMERAFKGRPYGDVRLVSRLAF